MLRKRRGDKEDGVGKEEEEEEVEEKKQKNRKSWRKGRMTGERRV